MGGGQGWGNIIKYQLEYVPPIQLGFLPSKILNIEKMLTELFIHKNGLVTIHNIWFSKNHGCYKWTGCKILIARKFLYRFILLRFLECDQCDQCDRYILIIPL